MDILRQYGTGCYVNEADVNEENWQTAFFGDNYERLLSIERRNDPDNLLINWKGIGWAGQEAQSAFRCYQHA